MRKTIASGTFALLLVLSNAAEVLAQMPTLGELSFSPPPGFRYENPAPTDSAVSMTESGPGWYYGIVLISAFPSAGDIDRDFSTVWQRHLAKTYGREPSIDDRYDYREAGYPGRFGGGSSDRSGVVTLYVLSAHGMVIPVAVFATTAAVRSDHSVVLELFLDGIRISPDRPEPVKRTVQLADLAGEWHEGGDSSVNWVDAFGNYAATTFVAHGVSYDVAADGSFSSSFAGISNGKILREKSSGRIELRDDLLILQETGKQEASRYRIISLQEAPNGVGVLTLLEAQYQVFAANIRMYAEKWYRPSRRRPSGADR